MIPFTLHPVDAGHEKTLPALLGITQQRSDQLKFIVQQACQRPKGDFIHDLIFFHKESMTHNEVIYVTFQYGVTVGTNMALMARGEQN